METFRKGKRTRKVLLLAVVLLVAAMVNVVPAQGQNLVANPLIYQSLLPPVNSFTDPSTLVKAVVWGEKIVTGTEAYSNMEIILNGSLMVENGGSLTLTNVTLKVNCTSQWWLNRIVVKSGGALYIKDSDGNPSTRNDASNITSYNPNYRFLFRVEEGATFQMRNSELHYCGYMYWTEKFDFYGLWIAANDTVVENNIFTNNYVGIILFRSCNSTIRGNIATNNDHGGFYLVGKASNTSITNNTATNNCVGFYFCGSDYSNVTGNIATNNHIGFYSWGGCLFNFLGNTATGNTYGFLLLVANVINLANNIARENDYGFYLESCYRNNLTGNIATGNDYYGFFLNNSWYNSLTNNTATDNIYGFHLGYSRYNNLTGNNAKRNIYGFHLSDDSNKNKLTGNFATKNIFGFYLSKNSRENYLANNTATGNIYDYFENPSGELFLIFSLFFYLSPQSWIFNWNWLILALTASVIFALLSRRKGRRNRIDRYDTEKHETEEFYFNEYGEIIRRRKK